jgi:hypothetical protein
MHNFHDVHERFPYNGNEPLWVDGFRLANNSSNRIARIHEYGWLSVLLPFVEQNATYAELHGILSAVAAASITEANRVPSSWPENEDWFYLVDGTRVGDDRNPFYRPISAFVCPSDSDAQSTPGRSGRVSYRLNRGDTGSPTLTGHTVRGIARPGYTLENGNASTAANISTLRRHTEATIAIPDGTSNTIFISERCVTRPQNDRRVLSAQFTGFNTGLTPSVCAGYRAGNLFSGTPNDSFWTWAGQAWGASWLNQTGFHTVLPPNAPSCTSNRNPEGQNGGHYITVSSYHAGGVNAAFGDASGRFINETINTGNLGDHPGQVNGVWLYPGGEAPTNNNIHRWGGPSTFGVWGALGTVSGGESASL